MRMRILITLFCSFWFVFPLCSQEDIPSISLVIRRHYRGEYELAERIKIACQNMNWRVKIYDMATFNRYRPECDWSLVLVPGQNRPSKQHNDFLVLFDPEHHYFRKDGGLNGVYRDYAGYLTTYPNHELIVNHQTQLVYPKPWYPTVQYCPYKKVNPSHLFCFLGHWGDRNSNIRYTTLYTLLANQGYTKLYGCPLVGRLCREAYKGPIEFDGYSVLERIADCGVCLILHSQAHLKHGIPSGRIFEAAASSAVIISDLNPFVIEYFGDSVLYFDQNLSGEEMFQQIDNHMNWIQEHPEEALDMAQRSHQIFEENFLLEDQLLDFHQFLNSNSSYKRQHNPF